MELLGEKRNTRRDREKQTARVPKEKSAVSRRKHNGRPIAEVMAEITARIKQDRAGTNAWRVLEERPLKLKQ